MILYIGNKLSRHGNTPTSIETLGKLLSKNFQVKSISDKKNKILRLSEMLWSIIKYRHKTKFILIDTYSTSNFYYALLCTGMARCVGVPYIPVLHGGKLENRLYLNTKMSDFIFKHSYANVAPSSYLFEIFKKYDYSVEYIPNNIEIENYTFTKRKNFRPRLLYVRAFSSIYNPRMALDVLSLLLQKYDDASLCMVGPDRDGTLERVKQQAEEMGLDDKVIFTGKLSKESWWKLSESYDIFINTTNVDNTPVSVMEAMALGLPVVSTNVGGIPYLVEDAKEALLVDAEDAEAMAEKILQLIEHPSNAVELAKNARKKVESFDWENVKPRWIELLHGNNK